MNQTIYLAGPDVFLPQAQDVLNEKKLLLSELGYRVLIPLDVVATNAMQIYMQNELRMQEADIIVANLEPFRGTEPDSGTVFEVGFGVALGKEVLTYNNPKLNYSARVKQYLERGKQVQPWEIESFGLKQNLMLSCSTREFETFADVLKYLTGKTESK